MKTLITVLLALILFSCEKPKEFKTPTKTVTVNTFGWMQNYKLKYKRVSGWVDTTINQSNYSVQYECNINELSHPVKIYSVERYDKDTLMLSVTVNTTLTNQAIVNKTEVECSLQPNQAL